MRLLRYAFLAAETASWHGFVLAVLLLGGSVPRLLVGGLWAVATVAAVLVLAASERRRPVLGAYVLVSRVALAASALPAAWAAAHLAPLAFGVACAAAAWLVVRRPVEGAVVRAGTLMLATVLAVDASWYARLGLEGECGAVIADPALRPLVLFGPHGARGDDDPLHDPRCHTGRTVRVDPESGALLLACGSDPPRASLSALTRLDPDRPELRTVHRDASSYEAVAIPEHERVWLAAFGRNAVVGLDRDSLEVVAQIVLRLPWLVEDDRRSDRVLVGAGGPGPGCLHAIDPIKGDLLASATSPPWWRSSGSCSPADIALLPELDRIVVSNFVGGLSLSAYRYSDLELVAERHRGVPTRDVVAAASGDRAWVAVPFLGRLEELDASSLVAEEPSGERGWRAVPFLGMLDPPGHKGLPEARRLRTQFGASYLADPRDGSLVLGNYMLGTLRRLDLESGALGAPLAVGRQVRDVTYDAERRRLYAVSACGLFEVDAGQLADGARGG